MRILTPRPGPESPLAYLLLPSGALAHEPVEHDPLLFDQRVVELDD